MKITSFEEFKELARRGTFVPVCKEIVADLLTPVSAFLKIAEHADYAFLLESVEGGDQAGFMVFDTVLAFDHVQHRILIIANARITPDEELESLYQFACAKIRFLERELERNLSRTPRETAETLAFTSNHTRARFEELVRAAKEHIAAGDIYQVVLSQRFEAE